VLHVGLVLGRLLDFDTIRATLVATFHTGITEEEANECIALLGSEPQCRLVSFDPAGMHDGRLEQEDLPDAEEFSSRSPESSDCIIIR